MSGSDQLPAGDNRVDVSPDQLLSWSEALVRAGAEAMAFTDSLYEHERFEEVLRVAGDIRGAAGGSSPAADLDPVFEWLRSDRHRPDGNVPKVAVGAAVGNGRGELLLIRRADSGVWLYPTGWADVGYSPAEVAVKEVAEETGIEVEPVRLIGVLDRLRPVSGGKSWGFYSLLFHCRAVGGTIRPHPLECLDAGWFAQDALPTPVVGYDRWGPTVFAAIRGEPVDVLFDRTRPQ
ncbi:MAG TPA: NUDIX domain-containing protein [Acidimicrobiales bacterium]|nr:NUDIX domain-containing protein [Acidimicrobiales bacterium]